MRENKTELIEFNKNGYFKKKNFFSKKIIKNLKDEIINLKDVNVFFDKKNQLRRIEKLYDKSSSLREINAKILKYISQLFKKDFVIFKDKLNSKPKGGDGFEPHYDGIFKFKKKNNSQHNGWYKYSNFFINVLIAIDKCNKKNGSLEISKANFLDFDQVLENTRKDGTPKLKAKYASTLKFQLINFEPGDVLFFSNLCPHRSKKMCQIQIEKFYITLMQREKIKEFT